MKVLVDGGWDDGWNVSTQHKPDWRIATDEEYEAVMEDLYRDPNEEEERPLQEVEGFLIDCT